MNLQGIVSPIAPKGKCDLWLKPVEGGVELYVMYGCKWQPLKVVNAEASKSADVIGSVQDKAAANTINGAKAYAKEAVDAVVGAKGDTAKDMTLYGLKKYIDKQISSLG